jgi:hypothetical protein
MLFLRELFVFVLVRPGINLYFFLCLSPKLREGDGIISAEALDQFLFILLIEKVNRKGGGKKTLISLRQNSLAIQNRF